MALLWYRQDGATRYEVRSAGNSVRLYTNGVFHSHFNPRQTVTGSVWDLLMLPAFFAPQAVRRVLVLGVGGGAVIRLLNQYLQPERIVGVELNPVHLEVARRYFGVDAPNVKLHCADALEWVRRYRGAPFDLIIEDLFSDEGGEPQRVVAADGRWLRRLGRLLSPAGAVVFNFVSPAELKSSAWFDDARLQATYPSAFRLTAPLYENAVGAFVRCSVTSADLRRGLVTVPPLERARRNGRLNYRIRPLAPK